MLTRTLPTLALLLASLALACDGEGESFDGDAELDAAVLVDAAPCVVPAPTSCPDPMPRYADVEPIFAERCVSCHFGGAGGPWPLTSYRHVADWNDTIRAAMLNCSMPPLGAARITVDDRVRILTWLRCGFPE